MTNILWVVVAVYVWVECGIIAYLMLRDWWTADGSVWTVGERHMAILTALYGPLAVLAALLLMFITCDDDEIAPW